MEECAHVKKSSICFVHIWCDYLAFLFYILFKKKKLKENEKQQQQDDFENEKKYMG